jgi:hypothetical protein
MAYSFSWENNGVYWKYNGPLEISDLIHANSEIIGHKKFENIRYIIWDATEVDLVTLDEIAVDISMKFSAIVNTFNSKIKVAFLAEDKHLIYLIEKYIELNRNQIPSAQQKLFDSLNDARSWAVS